MAEQSSRGSRGRHPDDGAGLPGPAGDAGAGVLPGRPDGSLRAPGRQPARGQRRRRRGARGHARQLVAAARRRRDGRRLRRRGGARRSTASPLRSGRAIASRAGSELRIGVSQGPGFRHVRRHLRRDRRRRRSSARARRTRWARSAARGPRARAGRSCCRSATSPKVRRLPPASGSRRAPGPSTRASGRSRPCAGPRPRPDFLTEDDMELLFSRPWTVDRNSNRTGIRLESHRFEWARKSGGIAGGHPSNILDNSYPVGAVNINGDLPVILGPDGPTAGGFVCAATVVHAGFWKIGQLRPVGDTHPLPRGHRSRRRQSSTASSTSASTRPASRTRLRSRGGAPWRTRRSSRPTRARSTGDRAPRPTPTSPRATGCSRGRRRPRRDHEELPRGQERGEGSSSASWSRTRISWRPARTSSPSATERSRRGVRKVLVANRGEIALRVIRACRELGLATVAVYSTADEEALHVRAADEAVCIGAAAARDSYLNVAALIAGGAADGRRRDPSRATASSPRTRASPRRARRRESPSSGPRPTSIERMGDKALARDARPRGGRPDGARARRHGARSTEALATAAELGYPVMVKAAAGGGGRGIRVARSADELAACSSPRRRARRSAAFGDRLPLPREAPRGRAPRRGAGARRPPRQRRPPLRARVLAAAPAPEAARGGALAGARPDARACDRRRGGAAGARGRVHERGDARVPARPRRRLLLHRDEHAHPGRAPRHGDGHRRRPRQGAAARRRRRAARRLVQEDVALRGAARSSSGSTPRIRSDDFLPSPGEITALELPGGPGVRVDTAVFAGYRIPPFYDSLVAKLIVWGRDRDGGDRARAPGARGVPHRGHQDDDPVSSRAARRPGFRAGDYHVDYLERRLAGLEGPI